MTQGDSNRYFKKIFYRLRSKSGNPPNFPLFSKRNIDKNRSTSPVERFSESDAPTEIRTPVLALKGLRPGPLDDGGLIERGDFIIPSHIGQAFVIIFPLWYAG